MIVFLIICFLLYGIISKIMSYIVDFIIFVVITIYEYIKKRKSEKLR